MANVSHLEPVQERKKGRMPWEEVQRKERGRERRNGEGSSAGLDNAILVAMKRGLHIFSRDLKASSGHR